MTIATSTQLAPPWTARVRPGSSARYAPPRSPGSAPPVAPRPVIERVLGADAARRGRSRTTTSGRVCCPARRCSGGADSPLRDVLPVLREGLLSVGGRGAAHHGRRGRRRPGAVARGQSAGAAQGGRARLRAGRRLARGRRRHQRRRHPAGGAPAGAGLLRRALRAHPPRWTCAGAPVTDPRDGRLLGVVDVSGPLDTMHPATLALVDSVAQLAEAELRERHIGVARAAAGGGGAAAGPARRPGPGGGPRRLDGRGHRDAAARPAAAAQVASAGPELAARARAVLGGAAARAAGCCGSPTTSRRRRGRGQVVLDLSAGRGAGRWTRARRARAAGPRN